MRSLSRQGQPRVERNDELRAVVKVDEGALDELRHNQYVIGIHGLPESQLSDERVATSVTIFSNDQQPTYSTFYDDWLAARCPGCTTLNASGFKLSIADTGVDTEHLDFSGRITIGTNFYNPAVGEPPNDGRDFLGHGTLVSTAAAGNPASPAGNPARDAGGYFMGTGLAYSAGIIGTKIFNAGGVPNNASGILNWAQDAYAYGARIQTHSHNDYGLGRGGQYTMESRDYDRAVRDADGNSTDGLEPILITVSAGNINQSLADGEQQRVRPPATAKNIIAVGGAENFRPGLPECNDCVAASFANVMDISQRGTDTPVIGGRERYKPDLTAPASMVVGARAIRGRENYFETCNENFDGNFHYWYHSGTSFASPAAAGAALLASRWYSSSPTAARPSLLKAMLIGSARNMYGGDDKVQDPATADIPTRPSLAQGFGRVHLDRLLSSLSQQFYNESQTIGFSGATYTTRIFTVRDFSLPVIVALVWTDAPGTADVANPLVNNLDLKVNFTDSQWYVGNSFTANPSTPEAERSILYTTGQSPVYDSINNVELVKFMPSNNEFRVRVIGTVIAGDGVPGNGDFTDQNFSLWVYNAW